MFTFKITNPAAPQNANPTPVYLGQANTLVFECSAGMHEQTQAGDQITIVLDQRLLDNPASLKVNSDYWKLGACTAQGNTYVLRCDFLAAFSLSEPFALQLEGLTPVSACVAQLNIQARFGGRPYSGSSQSLAVMNPPSAHKDLREVLSFELLLNDFQQEVMQQFYLSDADLQTPIANTLHLIVTCSTPPLTYDGNGPRPVFNLSFTYGEDQYSLTDAMKSNDPNYNALSSAWNIACQVGAGENDRWQAIAPNAATATPNWQLEGNTGNLFSQSEPVLDVFFSHVISRLPEGTAVLYLQWTNFKGYDDGVMALPIPKYNPQAKVIAFNSPQNNNTIAFDKPVALNWKIFGGKQVQLSWDKGTHKQDFPVYNTQQPALMYEGTASIIPNSPGSDFHIALDGVEDENAVVQVWVSNFPPPKILNFEGALVLLDDNSTIAVQFNWLVDNLGNNGLFELNGVPYDGTAYNGLPYQLQLPITGMQFPKTFTLIAIDKSTPTPLQSSSTITVDLPAWLRPEIKSFEGVFQKDNNGNITGLTLQFQLADIYAVTTCTINNTPVEVGKDGKGVLNLPVNAKNPLQSRFELMCSIPITAPIFSTLSSQYMLFKSQNTQNSLMAAIAICTQTQKIIGIFRGLNLTIRQCPLNDPGNWDAGVVLQNSSGLHLSTFGNLVIAPDGSQAILCGYSYYGLVYKNNQWQNTICQLTPTYNKNVFDALPAVYAPDMSLAFISGYYNITYFKPDPANYKPGTYVPAKTASANYLSAVSVAVTHDGSKLFVCDTENNVIWYCATNNIPASFTKAVHLPSYIQVLLAGKGNYLYLADGAGIYGMSTADENKMTIVELASTGRQVSISNKLLLSEDGTLLIYKGGNIVIVFSISPTDPSKLTKLGEIFCVMASDVAISPDNTRIFISTLNELLVYEAQFAQQGA